MFFMFTIMFLHGHGYVVVFISMYAIYLVPLINKKKSENK